MSLVIKRWHLAYQSEWLKGVGAGDVITPKKVKHTITSCSFRDVETERAGHDKVVSLLLTSGRLLAVKRRKTATDCVRSLTVIAYSHILGCPSPSYTSSMLIIHTFTKTLKKNYDPRVLNSQTMTMTMAMAESKNQVRVRMNLNQ